MKINVTYMSGAGNLFSVIDNRNYNFDIKQGKILAEILCNVNNYNKFRTEGLMLLENKIQDFDFECLFFNPDGSTGMMCGNGGRAITRFAELKNLISDNENIKFYMSGEVYSAKITENEIKLFIPLPLVSPEKRSININGILYTGYYSNTGTHHFVIITEENNINIENFDINKLGSSIRFHSEFSPAGVNVNFSNPKDNLIYLRTFEKGVEAETGACGTGAIAVALTFNKFYNIPFPIKISPTSKELLTIDNHIENGKIKNYILQGPAKVLDEVEIDFTDIL